ncbi:4824_t:CDS:2 [Rhizophagus irregularis]|nr:4824_t:CDS:2 [Rhizophagus irregularis]
MTVGTTWVAWYHLFPRGFFFMEYGGDMNFDVLPEEALWTTCGEDCCPYRKRPLWIL